MLNFLKNFIVAIFIILFSLPLILIIVPVEICREIRRRQQAKKDKKITTTHGE